METEKHYFKVGLFFIAIMAAFVYYVTTFGGGNGSQSLKRYTVYFDHSIDGLARGALVKLKGINVGLVHEIRFVSADNDRIQVTADIDVAAPVRADTVASVAFQGITGTTFLSLENTIPAASAPPLTTAEGEKYPVIQSQQSSVQSLLNNAPAMMGKLNQTVDQAQKLLSDKNVDEAEVLLPEAHDALTEAAAAFREIKMLARTLREDPSIILRGPNYDGYKVPKQ
jgi:phospholipid/cholesterol/gamma-HCH transport system substrate-binding protein